MLRLQPLHFFKQRSTQLIHIQVVTDQEGRPEAFKSFLERAKTGLVATWHSFGAAFKGSAGRFFFSRPKGVG